MTTRKEVDDETGARPHEAATFIGTGWVQAAEMRRLRAMTSWVCDWVGEILARLAVLGLRAFAWIDRVRLRGRNPE